MLVQLIMNVLEAVWGEGGVVGTGSPDCTRDPQQSQERGGGRGQPVHVNIRRGPTLGRTKQWGEGNRTDTLGLGTQI